MSHSFNSILALIEGDYHVQGSPAGIAVSYIKPIGEADESSLAWIDPARPDKQQLLEATRAAVVIGDPELRLDEAQHGRQVLVTVADPKLTVIMLAAKLFAPEAPRGIHPSAVVHPEARIDASAYIGPLTYIGHAEVGAGSVVYGNCHIYDNVRIGSNVIVQAGCVLGVAGLSLAKDDAGRFHNFPHLGGVLIEDDVELQALCVVDRGVLGDTVIGAGSKVNSGVYIGHNSRIGRHNFIAGHTMISGSVVTGDHCWFAPGAVTRDRLRIGANCLIGTGSVVVESLDENAQVMGNPAKPIADVKRLRELMKQLDADRSPQ